MANLLDETQGPVNDNGRDVHVIDRQLPVTITFRSTLFEIALWVTLPLLTLIYVLAMGDQLADPTTVAIGGCVAGVLPGVVFIFMKISARNYFLKLEQRIQAEASNIDNYLEQRVQILQNVVGLVNRAIDLDKDVMKAVAALRGGKVNEANRSDVNSQLNMACGRLFPQVEAYPDLKANQNFLELQSQLEGTENRINTARRDFNEAAKGYNTTIRRFPKNILAGMFGFEKKAYFEAEQGAEKAPKVEF